MANRHLARSVVLQSLFEWDFRDYEVENLDEIIENNSLEFGASNTDKSFMKDLCIGVIKKKSEIDAIIAKAAPDWPIDKISTIDRNVLRIGLYELLFGDRDEVPAKVAINESIELAKNFGGENSGRFVNGVLGSVYKEIGEPGKDAISKKKDEKFTLPFEKMPIVKLGGAVVFARNEGKIVFAFVHDVFGHWTLSKGSIEENEELEAGTIRKIKEEIGLDIKIVSQIDSNEYVATHPEKGKLRKQVTYFLAESEFVEPKLKESGGLDRVQWFSADKILDLNMYADILPIITKAINLIPKK